MKHFLHSVSRSLLTAAAMTLSMTAMADASPRLITENFVYDVGDLYNRSNGSGSPWYKYASNTADPIQVTTPSLTFDGYCPEPIGNAVTLSNTASGQDLMKLFDAPVGTGSLYASFIINVSEAPTTKPGYFFSLINQSKTGLEDGRSSSEYGRVFARGNDNGTYNLAITRATAFNENYIAPTQLAYGTSYLVVLKYEFVDGDTNDKVSLFINPADTAAEPTADVVYSDSSGSDLSITNGGAAGVLLRQSQTGSYNAPVLRLDALRVANTWSGIFSEESEGPTPPTYTGEITLGVPTLGLDPMIAGATVQGNNFLTATGLTDDITVTCSAGITCDKTVIPASTPDIATDGVSLTYTITPNPAVSGPWSGTITFSSPGCETVVFTVSCDEVIVPTTVANCSRINSLYQLDGAFAGYYKYTGKAVVTYIEPKDYYYLIYAQDLTGAVCINTSYTDMQGSAIAVGDEISNFICMFSDEDPVGLQLLLTQTSETGPLFTKTATGKEKTPTEVTVGDFDAAYNQYRLIRLNSATFAATGTFAAQTYQVTTPDGNASVRPFAGTDLIGTEIPGAADVVGISKSKNAMVIWPRSAADIIAASPFAEFSTIPLFNFTDDAAPINTDTQIARITVNAGNIAAPAPVYVTGANADMFSVSPAVIPAGTAITEVTVTYHPTATGRHNANIYFDFDGTSSELNHSVSIRNCLAYDPQNLPVLTMTPAELTLRANIGQTVTGTATLGVTNAFDYINVTKSNQQATGIIINSAQFLPSVSQQTVTVTFQPQAEGNVDQTFTFTTLKGEPVTLTIHGIVGGTVEPEQPEGGELNLDTSNPYSLYSQDFSSAISNKPLDIAGWCNVAEEGTRAWWGYQGEDFSAAKVTAYDSKIAVGEGTPCQMLLVSPALSYAGAPSKTLKFRLMGKGLYEGMTDILDICLVELVNGEAMIYPMQGFDIPVTEDMDSQWIDYDNIDMSVVEDMPDPFFIGFRFTSTRGRDNAAQYFITDFSWGEAPTGVKNVYTAQDGFYTVYTMQGVRVMRTAEASDLDRLPAGMYIINGKKVIRK